jgi:DHA2 family multidrug resistance protein-like MFS transporter
VAAVVVVAATWFFVRRDLRHPDPVFQPRFFRRRAFASANAGIGMSNLAMYTFLLSVPLLLASQGRDSTLESGLVLTALSAATIAMAPFGGRLADASTVALTGTDIPVPMLVVALGVIGAGVGLSSSGLQASAVESVEPQSAGAASGVYSASRYMVCILGSTLLGALLEAERSSGDGLSAVFFMATGASLSAVVAGLGLRARPDDALPH